MRMAAGRENRSCRWAAPRLGPTQTPVAQAGRLPRIRATTILRGTESSPVTLAAGREGALQGRLGGGTIREATASTTGICVRHGACGTTRPGRVPGATLGLGASPRAGVPVLPPAP